jgi:hypothetical protein
MGKKVAPKFSAYLYQWTRYAEDFNIIRNLRRKGGNTEAGRRLALANRYLEESNPKPRWLVCGQFKGGQFKVYAMCKLRAPSEEEKRYHAEELKRGDQAFEKYVYVDDENSFIVALPGNEGSFDRQLDKLLQVQIGKRNGQLQGANGLEIQIDDFDVERLKRSQIMTVADRIRQLGQVEQPEKEPEGAQPQPPSAVSAGNAPDTDVSGITGKDSSPVRGDNAEPAIDLEELKRKIDEECVNLEGQDVDAVVKRRVGQGVFRNMLLGQFDGVCCVTGLTNVRLLIASHIVPWSKSAPAQKLDPENGLLLSVSMDALFDKGLISFSDSGRILIGDDLDAETIEILGLEREFALSEKLLTDARKENLAKHRVRHRFDLPNSGWFAQ